MLIWLKRIGLFLLAGICTAAVLLFAFVISFYRSPPSYDGELAVAGLTSAVTTERDAYGIPHIAGASIEDAAFGLGYAHAQDRLFQMEMTRRVIQGRIA